MGLFFPAFQQEDLHNLLWKDSLPGVRYVYPVLNEQANCTGMVTEIQYCFKYTPQAAPNVPLQVFTLTILDNMTGREVSVNVSTYLQVSNESCETNRRINYCCDTMFLNNQILPFPMNNLTIIISTSRSNVTLLQLLRNTIVSFSYFMDLHGKFDSAQSPAVVRFKCKCGHFCNVITRVITKFFVPDHSRISWLRGDHVYSGII